MNLSRRATSWFLLTAPAVVRFGLLGFGSSAAAVEGDTTTNDLTVEQWMSAWMSVDRPVSGALHLWRFKDPIYILMKPIRWMPAAEIEGPPAVEVPKGFVTDFASIPRVFWSVLPPDGEYTYPAIIHDYLYWEQTTSRETADKIFKMAMEDFRIQPATALTIFAGVRAGGSLAWESNRKLKAGGEKRVLKRFPEDPLITWSEWKKEPDVF